MRVAVTDDCASAADVLARAMRVAALRSAMTPKRAPPPPPRKIAWTRAPRIFDRSCGDVVAAVAAYYGIGVGDIIGSDRHRAVTLPRQMAVHLCRRLVIPPFQVNGKYNWSWLGRRFKRDRTTVRHAAAVMAALVAAGGTWAADAVAIEAALDQRAPPPHCRVFVEST